MNALPRQIVDAYLACPNVDNHVELADRAALDAMAVIGAVRELDPREVWGTLAIWSADPNRNLALVTCLAAMVPHDRTPAELRGWITPYVPTLVT